MRTAPAKPADTELQPGWRRHLPAAATAALAAFCSMSCTRADSKPQTDVAPVGEFSNMRQDSQHCTGYSVALWKSGKSVAGLMSYCAGMVGDQRTGLLTEQAFDSGSGRLSFKTKLSIGSHYSQGTDIPTRDVWRFQGEIRNGRLTGTVTKRDLTRPNKAPQAETLSLPRTATKLPAYATPEAWQSMADKTLKLSGPGW